MYSSDNVPTLSAKRTWQRATYYERESMMHEAGHAARAIHHTWQNFDELPLEIKVDLNNAHTAKLANPHKQLVIDVLRRAQANGCKLVIDSNDQVISTQEVMPGHRVIANTHKQHALFKEAV